MGRVQVLGPRQPSRHSVDSEHFDRWVGDYAPELYRFAFRLCGESAVAEDLVQEAFYEAWKHRGPLRSIREPRAWLFVILRRRYGKWRRSEQRWMRIVSLDAVRSCAATSEPDTDHTEKADTLQSALDGMSDLLKLPLLMVFVQGMTCVQAAEQLDVPLGTVLSRIYRAKRHLRDRIDRQDNGIECKAAGGSEASGTGGQPRLRIGGV